MIWTTATASNYIFKCSLTFTFCFASTEDGTASRESVRITQDMCIWYGMITFFFHFYNWIKQPNSQFTLHVLHCEWTLVGIHEKRVDKFRKMHGMLHKHYGSDGFCSFRSGTLMKMIAKIAPFTTGTNAIALNHTCGKGEVVIINLQIRHLLGVFDLEQFLVLYLTIWMTFFLPVFLKKINVG